MDAGRAGREGTPLRQGLKLSFHGAAGTVTGSKHLLEVDRHRILLDAGMFQGKKELRLRNWERPAFDPAAVDQVLLSHTHIDHVGYLPRLVKEGLTAPVYMTPAAFELAELMLLDAAKIQEEDARHAARKGYSKHKEPKPLFDTDDAQKALDLRQAVDYEEWIDLLPDGRARARFLNSGHLLGAAFIELRIQHAGEEVRIVYSGDVGRFEVPLHLDPEPMPECDVLLLESTYGDRDHSNKPILEQIRDPFLRTLERGGTVLIPAFAVGRSQQITLMLRRLMKEGALPEVPIHLDSPMAINATRIYSRFLNEDNIDPDVFEDGRLQLFPEKVHFHRTVDESKELNGLSGPRVLISSSGMLTGGRILHHLKRLAPDPKNLVLLAGYQAVGTRGRSLADGARAVKVHGQYVNIRCEVASFRGLSGHADRGELLRWVGSAKTPPKLVFLVHGEPEAALALKQKLHDEMQVRSVIPALEESFDLLARLWAI
jgi:metallo-beta-lactamase family protein